MKNKWLALLAAGVTLTGCGPSEQEKETFIATLSPVEKTALKLWYDRVLLDGYDGGLSPERAHKRAYTALSDKETNPGSYYFLQKYAAYRLKQSRQEHVSYRTQMQYAPGYGPVKLGHMRYMPTTVRETTYTYYADFPEKLRFEVHQAEQVLSMSAGLQTETTHIQYIGTQTPVPVNTVDSVRQRLD